MKLLADWRWKNHLSRTEAAKMIGVTRASYWNWETGRSAPSYKSVKRISEATGIPISKLMKEAAEVVGG